MDDIDDRILGILVSNSRLSSSEIRQILRNSGIRLTGRTIRRRISQLVKSGVIQGFTVNVDPEKLGMRTRRLLILKFRSVMNFESRVKDLEQCIKKSQFCAYSARLTGDLLDNLHDVQKRYGSKASHRWVQSPVS